jgi:Family of unknown function (DUF6011)
MPNDFLDDLERSIPGLHDNLTFGAARASTPSSSPSSPRFEAVDATLPDMRGRLTDPADAERFALAGKATITLVSVKTGNRFTYRVSISPDGACHFVALLSGPDNESDYKYLGRIARGIFWQGRKTPRAGDIGPDAPSSKAFAFAWRAIVSGSIPSTLEIWHEGHCGRCNRKLTVPQSIAHGFGPECYGKLGLAALEQDF